MPQLDGLRAIAVGLVLLGHYVPRLGRDWGMPTAGVKLFFVLSGYLITRILLLSRNRLEGGESGYGRELWGFYGRRFLRLFPALFVLITLAAVIGVEPVRSSYWWHVTYLSNIWLARNEAWVEYVSHLWSLAVEEQFYLIWPLAILLIPRKRWVVFTIGIMFVGALFRLDAVLTNMNHIAAYVLPFASLNALGFGALLAISERTDWGAWLRRLSLSAGMPLLAALLILIRIHVADLVTDVLYDSVIGFAFVWLVSGAAEGFGGWGGRVLSSRLVVALGGISYGVYLYHAFAPELIGWAFQKIAHPGPMYLWPERLLWVSALRLNSLTTVALDITVSIVAAALSWWLVEQPAKRLRQFLPYSNSDHVSVFNTSQSVPIATVSPPNGTEEVAST